MDLSIKVMSRENTIGSILHFQSDNNSLYWRESLFEVYPFLDKEKGLHSKWEDRSQYLADELSLYYDKVYKNLQNKLQTSCKIWTDKKESVNRIYSEVFGVDCSNLFNDMLAEISLNPICPRNLHDKSFSVFFAADENNFFKTALHEMIHFVWFYVWEKHFKDKSDDYDAPNLKWVLSEMVVDTFVKNTAIGDLYPENYKKRSAYSYFYNMKINGESILAQLSNMYKNSQNVTDFMEQAYTFCQKNEKSIREQML